MKAMWMRFCRSADGLTLPLIALAAAVLGWGAVAEYHAQLEVQQRDAKHVSQLVAREIDLVLSEQHRTLAVFAEGNHALLAALAENPNNSTLLNEVNRSLARHFEPYIAFTMADAHGNEIIDDFDGNVGDPKAFDLTMDLATLLESLMTALQQGPEQDNPPATG